MRWPDDPIRHFVRALIATWAQNPAAAQMIPRFAALWAQTVVRTFHEAMEGKRG